MLIQFQRTGTAMDRQMPDDIEIGYSSRRLLRLVGIGVVMTLLSASVAFNWFAAMNADGFHVVAGYFGIVFFGLATLKCGWTLLTARGPVVAISRYGIRDQRISNELILWGSVEAIALRAYRGQKFIALKVSPALERHLFATTTGQLMQAANRLVGAPGVIINPSGLAMDVDALFETCTAYHAAVERSRVLVHQTDAGIVQGITRTA